jgi:hypothetical protein
MVLFTRSFLRPLDSLSTLKENKEELKEKERRILRIFKKT